MSSDNIETFFDPNNYYLYKEAFKSNPMNETRIMLLRINPSSIVLEYQPLNNIKDLYAITFNFHPDVKLHCLIDENKKGTLIDKDKPIKMNRFVFDLELDYRPREKEMYAIKDIKIQPLDSQKTYTFQDIGHLVGTNDNKLWQWSCDYGYLTQWANEKIKSDKLILEQLCKESNNTDLLELESMLSLSNHSLMVKIVSVHKMMESEPNEDKKKIFGVYKRILHNELKLDKYKTLKERK